MNIVSQVADSFLTKHIRGIWHGDDGLGFRRSARGPDFLLSVMSSVFHHMNYTIMIFVFDVPIFQES